MGGTMATDMTIAKATTAVTTERPFKLNRALLARLKAAKTTGASGWVWMPGMAGRPNTLFGRPYTLVDEPTVERTYSVEDRSATQSGMTIQKLMENLNSLTAEYRWADHQDPVAFSLLHAEYLTMSDETFEDLRSAAGHDNKDGLRIDYMNPLGPRLGGIRICVVKFMPRGVIGIQGPGGVADVKFIVPPSKGNSVNDDDNDDDNDDGGQG